MVEEAEIRRQLRREGYDVLGITATRTASGYEVQYSVAIAAPHQPGAERRLAGSYAAILAQIAALPQSR